MDTKDGNLTLDKSTRSKPNVSTLLLCVYATGSIPPNDKEEEKTLIRSTRSSLTT